MTCFILHAFQPVEQGILDAVVIVHNTQENQNKTSRRLATKSLERRRVRCEEKNNMKETSRERVV